MLRRGGKSTGIPYSSLATLDIEFKPEVHDFHDSRQLAIATVLSGPNNAGKTLLLKQLRALSGHTGYMISCNRFSHVDILNTRSQAEDGRQFFDNFMHQFYTATQNTDENELKLEQVITGLKDNARDRLFRVCTELIGRTLALRRTDPQNTFSPFYVDIDGQNAKYASTGTRLLLTMLGILLDERFDVILLDEPELGLSPKIQAAVASFFYDEDRRREFCPHLRHVYVATHSHLFLDRDVLSNNHIIAKAGSVVSIAQVNSVSDYHELQFNMLRNDLEAMFLPSAVVIVEGESDITFLRRVVQLHIPDRKVTLVSANGEGEVLKKVNVLSEAFGGLSASPYRNRLCVILDARHSVTRARIEKSGVPTERIRIWSKNDIEYSYPPDLVAQAFRCSLSDVSKMTFANDPISCNGILRSKRDLSELVAAGLSKSDALPSEVTDFIAELRQACI